MFEPKFLAEWVKKKWCKKKFSSSVLKLYKNEKKQSADKSKPTPPP